MLILGIDTATPQVGCAIGGHEGVLASFHAARGRRHAETLVPAIEFLCKQARIELSEIGAIAVDIGPGMFTGLRVGVATGKAMASALRIPMVIPQGIWMVGIFAFVAMVAVLLLESLLALLAGQPERLDGLLASRSIDDEAAEALDALKMAQP